MLKKIKSMLNRKYLVILILVFILFGGFGARLYKINTPLADWHSWRQADTASVTKIYLQNGIDLLHPRYHDISRVQTSYFNPDGFRYVEFPFFNLAHVSLVSAFPFLGVEVSGRLISVLSATITSIFLFLIARKYVGDFGGLLASFYYLFFPFNIYFTRVILPDPMAVMFAVSSIYFFYLFTERESKHLLLLSSVLFAISMLVKPHAIFFSIPIVLLAVKKYGLIKSLKSKWLFLAFDIVAIPFLLWRIWIYQPGLIRGIANYLWAFNGDEIRFKPSFWRWLFGERIGNLILGIWGIGPFFLGLLNFQKKTLLTFAFLMGVFLYFAVFATANVKHDYYQIFVVPAIALTVAQGVVYLFSLPKINKIVAAVVTLFVTFLMFGISWYAIRDNYQIINPQIVEAGIALDKIAAKDALVIAPYNGDTAFLYQTNRSGWPVITEDIKDMINQGADYYVSVDLGSNDTKIIRTRYQVIEERPNYIIIDLSRPI